MELQSLFEDCVEIKEITQKLEKIMDIYSNKFNILRDDDWFLLKIQEELGELTSAHLKLSNRGRSNGATQEEIERNLRDEIADVLALTLLYAKHKNIDPEKSISDKWFKHL